ncbi:T9SS type A sorting domain-containing protein [Hymenobacter volaticus]|uniref:T9SS type A sorting domain-containing protein n=1 Tax=Hymenobacter volaticus TaxID=2932254 RepID=A0ABY4GDD9_9BACT|nr:T9SS type A sorting domain-containing protein [Hymenobacter volaticus]UOQ68761.1 T9SS type A sorting domain-containing protein [Hymenobacter volaticus]
MDNEAVAAVAVQGANVYVTGWFSSTTLSLGAITLANAHNGNNIFVAKLTDAGSTSAFTWGQQVGGVEEDKAYALAVNGNSVYIAGKISGPVTFGGIPLTSDGYEDAFLAKLTDMGMSGTFVWAQKFGCTGGFERAVATCLTVKDSKVYLAGQFYGATGRFGSFTVPNAGSAGTEEIFVAKIIDAGSTASVSWAKSAGGATLDKVNALALRGDDLYLAGRFDQTGANFEGIHLTSSGAFDGFVAKLKDYGREAHFSWAQKIGGLYAEVASAVAVNGTSIYVAGRFSSPSVAWGSTTLYNTDSNASTTYTTDVFVAQLMDSGPAATLNWVTGAGGLREDEASVLALSGTTLYVGGSLQPAASFGSHTITSPTTNPNNSFAFLTALTAAPLRTNKPAFLPGVRFYPNPACSSARVEIPAVPSITYASLTLRNIVGQVVRTQSIRLAASGTAAEVSVLGLTPGIYQMQVQAGNQSVSHSLAVE